MIDPFGELARYYDPLMVHVDYDRWYVVAGALASLLPRPFIHVDLACGTGTLLRKLRRGGWNSFGLDLSYSMLRAGAKDGAPAIRATADLRALPLNGRVDYLTCLFDSMNFLLEFDDVRQAFHEAYGALKDDGLFYFDVVTEKMVLDHFANQKWTENNGQFKSTWDTEYSRNTNTAETHIQVNQGPTYTIRERVYDLDAIVKALEDAGFRVLGALDAETWKQPKRRTVRVDIVAAKGSLAGKNNGFGAIRDQIRNVLS